MQITCLKHYRAVLSLLLKARELHHSLFLHWRGMRNDTAFELVWALVQKKALEFDFSEPQLELPRQRKVPRRIQVGSGNITIHKP